MMNRVVLVGRMTRDPELRKTASGNAVCHFTLALERNFKSGDGQEADFIPVMVWNKAAENVAKYCNKGSLVGVDGTLRSRSYENKNGQRVFIVEVRADNVQFLDTRAARERRQSNSDFYANNQASAQNRVSNDNFYNGNSYGNNQQNNSYAQNNYNAGNNQQAKVQNNNYSQQNRFNTAGNVNQNQPKPQQNQNNEFRDMKTVDADKSFNEAMNSYNIMDDDIQF